jgi:predicted Zn-dependent peptidase
VQEERDVEQAHLVLGFEGVSQKDPDYFAAQILSSLLGGGMSSRLFQQVREKRGLAYSVFSYCWSFSDTGLFGIYAGTNPQDIEQATHVIADELKNLSSSVSQKEIDMARAQIKAGLLMGLESSYVRAERMARQFMTFGREIPIEEIIEQIDRVNLDKIRALSNTLFDADKLSAALVSSPSHALAKDQIRSAF